MKVPTAEEFIKEKYGIQEYNNYEGTQAIDFMKAYATMIIDSMTDDEINATYPDWYEDYLEGRMRNAAKGCREELRNRIK